MTVSLASGGSALASESSDFSAAGSQVAAVSTANPTTLVYTTSPQTITAGATTALITVQRRDASNNPTTSGTTNITLTSSSANGVFRDTGDTTTITSIAIANGSASASFKYTDGTAGSSTITAADAARVLTSATQSVTVTGGAAAMFAVSPATRPQPPPGPATLHGGHAQDVFGNLASSYAGTVTFSATNDAAGGPADELVAHRRRRLVQRDVRHNRRRNEDTDRHRQHKQPDHRKPGRHYRHTRRRRESPAGRRDHDSGCGHTGQPDHHRARRIRQRRDRIHRKQDPDVRGKLSTIGSYHPSVTDNTGTPVNFGSATTITFTNGVATISGSANGGLTLDKAESATITVSDGTIGNTGLNLTVSAAPVNRFGVTAPATATAGMAFSTTTLTAQDLYGNTVTSYTGAHTITWTGAATSPAPSSTAPSYPATAVSFTNGVATTTLTATLYSVTGPNVLTASATSPIRPEARPQLR